MTEQDPEASDGKPAGPKSPGEGEAGSEAPPAEVKKGPIVERRGGGAYVPPAKKKPERAQVKPKHAPASEGAELSLSERVLRRQATKAEPPLEPPPAPELPVPVEAESFAQLFAASASQLGNRVAPGQKVTGRILQIGRETTFLDLGAAAGIRTEALIDSRELRDEHGTVKFQVGELITGYVKSLEDGIWITTALPKGAQREALQGARETGMPVEGTVIGVNKGGLEVDLGSGLRGFVPASQASARFTADLAAMVGQKLQFLVTQVKDRDIVLSRRALLEREAKGKAEALRDTLVPGSQLEGSVTSLREFGAFVDLGGLEGLIPISELSHRRVAHPEEILKVGQTVTVEVLRVEPPASASDKVAGKGGEAKERITLSLKRLEDDPWLAFGNAIVEGQRFKGKVVRLQPFGAFVELSPGVDGLVHVSRLTAPGGRRLTHPEEALKEGQELWVEVDTIDRASRKDRLAPLERRGSRAARAPASRASAGGRCGGGDRRQGRELRVVRALARGPRVAPRRGARHPARRTLRRSHPVGAKLGPGGDRDRRAGPRTAVGGGGPAVAGARRGRRVHEGS